MFSSIFVRSQTGRLAPVLLAALLLAGCPSHQPQTPAVNIQDNATAGSDYYLQQMQQSSDNNKADWQLLAIRALLHESNLPQASLLMEQFPHQLNPLQQQELRLLQAELQVAQNNSVAANATLAQIDVSTLSANQQMRYYQAQISANQSHSSLTLLRAYIAQEPLLPEQARQSNIDQTWQALLQLTPQQINNLVINADENTLRGWLDLLRVYQDNRQDPAMLKAGITDWQIRYPQNPAARTLPVALYQVRSFQQASTTQIALLLPVSGQAQLFAQAIEQGFNAAKTGLPAAPPTTARQQPATGTQEAGLADHALTSAAADFPAADDAMPEIAMPEMAMPVTSSAPVQPVSIKVYDTSAQPLDAVLAQAQQEGASLIVGPLLKSDVEQLTSLAPDLNILALNQPENITDHPNICYFALSPEDEARDAARHIHAQSKVSPLLLVPRGAFGDRVATAFADEWQKLGGGSVRQQGFGSTIELKQAINNGAGISLTGQVVVPSKPVTSPAHAVTIGNLEIPSPPSDAQILAMSGVSGTGSRAGNGSVDAVYIVATPDELTLLKPMIDMRTNARNKPAFFASSRSHQAGSGPDYRLEMEGVEFSDIPLLAGANPVLLNQASQLFKNDYSLVRLYATGIDAWTLANHFSEMRQLPGFQLAGSTGELSATPQCVITRKLPWQQYRQGLIVPAS